MIRELTLELKKDYRLVRRQIKYLFFIVIAGLLLSIYNSNFLKLDESITKLNQQKNYLQSQKIKLESEVANLMSPDRISKLAKEKLDMQKVDLHNVVFIESK
jgi:cell division protein FtsL